MRRHSLLNSLVAVAAGVVLAGCSAKRITAASPAPATAPQRLAIGSGDVLYILDGKILERRASGPLSLIPNEISALHPEDVSSIEVIKGEAARKRFGAAGENGVVLITTKHRD